MNSVNYTAEKKLLLFSRNILVNRLRALKYFACLFYSGNNLRLII